MVTPSKLRFGKELQEVQISDIQALIQNKIDESQNLEYKKASEDLDNDCKGLARTISGFLNTDGGILVYGVCERRDGNHRYPTEIKWCGAAKERLEDLLKSRIQPWEERIKIKRIENKENRQRGIFVIEIPQSSNPPHMYHYSYYHRLNFQTQPMSHQNVFRAFQTSWIRRRDLYRNVIEPLYSEIKLSCGSIEKYEQGVAERYLVVIRVNRYLYDQIESSLRERIDEFYIRMGELNSKLLYWPNKIAIKIINEELCRISSDHKRLIERRMEHDNLFVNVTVKDPGGSVRVIDRDTVNGALLQRMEIKEFLQSKRGIEEVVKFEPVFYPAENLKIDGLGFRNLWEKCKSRAAKNKVYLSIWNETLKLLTLGREILRSILEK